MKKTIATTLLLFFFMSLFAQEEVIFNLSRKKTNSIKFSLTLYVNGVEAAKLKNGESATYRAKVDVSQPITVMAKFGKTTKTITFTVSPGNKCDLEAYWPDLDESPDLNKPPEIFIDLKSGGTLTGNSALAAAAIDKQKKSIANYYKNLGSDSIRQQWIDKGGKIVGGSYNINASFLKLDEITGTGGQLLLSSTRLNIKIPEYKVGSQTWSSGVFGVSYGFQFYSLKVPGMKSMNFINQSFSLNLGYTLGIGKFKDKITWKGVAFELTYRPSITYSTSFPDGDDSFSTNFMGFGLEINFNNFTSNARKLAPRPQSKLSVFILPPVKDLPLFISIGYGQTFYSKVRR